MEGRVKYYRYLIIFTFFFFLLFLFFKNVHILEKSVFLLLTTSAWLAIIVVILLTIEVALEVLRLKLIVRNPFSEVAKAYLISIGTAFVVTPRVMGEIARAEILSKILKEEKEKMLAFISVERLLDVSTLAIFAMLIIVSLLKKYYLGILLISLPLLFILVIILLKKHQLKLPGFIQNYLEHSRLLLANKEYLIAAIVLTIFIWIIDFLRIWIVMKFFKVKVSYLLVASLASISYLSGVLSILPGGLGVYEAAFASGLIFQGNQPEKAIAAILYDRIFSYWLIVSIAIGLLLKERKKF